MADKKKVTAGKAAASRDTGSRKAATKPKKDENTLPVDHPKLKPAYRKQPPCRTKMMEDTTAAALLSMGNVMAAGPLMEDVVTSGVVAEDVDTFDVFVHNFSSNFDYTVNSEGQGSDEGNVEPEQDGNDTDPSEVEDEEDDGDIDRLDKAVTQVVPKLRNPKPLPKLLDDVELWEVLISDMWKFVQKEQKKSRGKGEVAPFSICLTDMLNMDELSSNTGGKKVTFQGKKSKNNDSEDQTEATPALKEHKLFKKITEKHYCQACKTACVVLNSGDHHILSHSELTTWALLVVC
ncbi:hypothetical protein C8R44DRAFT_731706 [Mycena epipterygia]|nr:hypothetical protein C8R44DRAFT_731706 [Mycena epipterygia]